MAAPGIDSTTTRDEARARARRLWRLVPFAWRNGRRAWYALALACLLVGERAVGALGAVLGCLAVCAVIWTIGFVGDQRILTHRGAELARGMDDVLALKRVNAAAFTQPLGTLVRGMPATRFYPDDARPASPEGERVQQVGRRRKRR